MGNKIVDEISAVTKCTPKTAKETEQEFLARLYEKANKMSDANWAKLSDETQNWVNEAGKAAEEDKDLPSAGDLEESEEEVEDTGKKAKASGKKAAAKAPAKAAAKSAPKGKASTKAKSGESRGRKGSFELDATITVKADENPHRKGSGDFDKFKKLKSGQSVEKAVGAGVDWGYLRYAVKRDLITIK